MRLGIHVPVLLRERRGHANVVHWGRPSKEKGDLESFVVDIIDQKTELGQQNFGEILELQIKLCVWGFSRRMIREAVYRILEQTRCDVLGEVGFGERRGMADRIPTIRERGWGKRQATHQCWSSIKLDGCDCYIPFQEGNRSRPKEEFGRLMSCRSCIVWSV